VENLVYELSANLELLFTEADPSGGVPGLADGMRRAAAHGLRAVEIWAWRDRDIDALAQAQAETGTVVQTMCVEPMGGLVDPETHPAFLAGLTASAAVADRLGCPFLVVTAGDDRPGVARDVQRRAVVHALRAGAAALAPFRADLVLENLNSRVEHPGTFLDTTAECLDIVAEVASPRVRVLYDLYHSLVMDERPETVLAGRADLVAHVQIADVPGRHEPGSASVDWQHELDVLSGLGYRGRIGLEYRPTTTTTESLRHIRALAGEA
jgi:hydroxypyruvate isomerase